MTLSQTSSHNGPCIVSVEWARLEGRRPRAAGCNARLGEHGAIVRVPLARLTADDGSQGFGACRATPDQAQAILGQPLDALFDPHQGATPLGLPFDFPLWDLAGQRAGRPVYALAATMAGLPAPEPLRVPCYDTSLYMDDLHLADDEAAAALIAEEAREGWARGHRAFKIKVGRGARHMPLEAGARRDIAVIQAVRAAVEPQTPLMIDANNGYNLNLAKQVLAATADCNLFWLEEAFHEDRVLYEDLQQWLRGQGLSVLIADGEGQASPALLEWAEAGVVQVVQYDIFSYSFTPWLALGRRLDRWGVRTAPHHYGGHYGNYAAAHLAAAIQRFTYVEWDEATTPGLDAHSYAVEEGQVLVPNLPGFGLALDEERFEAAVASSGWTAR
ncbi:MAG TPA: enolase C-terminal domain-like protein [Caldilineaceae bacterium]|nr:enolase C-terminal domain-like protein [Caldilineaceae bacterium]